MKRTTKWVTAVFAALACVVAMAFAFAPASPVAQGGASPFASVIDVVADGDDGAPDAAAPPDQAAGQDSPEGSDGELPAYEEGAVLVSLDEGLPVEQARDAIARETGLQDVSIESVTDTCAKVSFGGQTSVEDAVKAITHSGAVASAQPNFAYYAEADDTASQQPESLAATDGAALQAHADAAVDDPLATKWMLESIEAYDAWKTVDADKGKKSVTVAVIDQGFRLSHEDFTGKFVYNAANGKYDKPLFVDPYNAFTGKAGAKNIVAQDSHGSHVVGIIAAHANNGKGVAGVTNNMVQILPVQAFDKTGKITYTDRLVKAIDWVIKKSKENNVRVMNMSVGGGVKNTNWSATDRQLLCAIAEAHDKNIVAVVSSGNVNSKDPKSPDAKAPFYHMPSDFEECVAVINLFNTDSSNPKMVNRYSTSNYNRSDQMVKDISAPGTDITSVAATGDDRYVQYSGTSMAAPVVAGVMALMFTTDNKLSVDEAVSKLYSSSAVLYSKELNLGDPLWSDDFGYGEVNAKQAVGDGEYLSGATSLFVGEKQAYKLNLPKGVKVAAKDVEWSLYKPIGGGKLATVSSKGKSATLTGKKPGSFVLVATAKAGNTTYRAVQTIVVYDADITGSSKIELDDKEQYCASGSPSISGRKWVWKSSNPNVASVSADGVVTAKKLGTTKLTVTLASNKKITDTKKITVTKIDLGDDDNDITANYKAPIYTGSPLKPKFAIYLNEKKSTKRRLVEGKDYKIDYSKNVNAGKNVGIAKIIALPGSAVCRGTGTCKFTIKPASIAKAAVSGVANRVFTDKTVAAQNPVVKVGKTKLKAGTDYVLSYQNAKKQAVKPADLKAKGTYNLVIKGKGNYDGTVVKPFSVVSPGVTYRVNLQKANWQKWVKDGATAGDSGAKQLEQLQAKTTGGPFAGGLEYRLFLQKSGWQKWVREGATAGLAANRAQTVQMRLTGDLAKQCDVYYRVKSQQFGWMGWAKNGNSAGVSGFPYRLEAIQVKVVLKGAPAPGPSANAFRKK